MKKRSVCYTEIAYILGLVILGFGTAFMEKAGLGMSMVVAPAYIIHLKVSQYLSFFTFGFSEYVFQGFLLIVMCIVLRKPKIGYLFSFVTAFIYGNVLDLCIRAVSYIPCETGVVRVIFYIAGMLLCSLGVAFFFHTYIAPEAYELFVKEISAEYNRKIDRVKTVYDICSCLIGVILSFSFFGFGHFEGVKYGTIICAVINGFIIGKISRILESVFEFRDGLKLRRFFTSEKKADTDEP